MAFKLRSQGSSFKEMGSSKPGPPSDAVETDHSSDSEMIKLQPQTITPIAVNTEEDQPILPTPVAGDGSLIDNKKNEEKEEKKNNEGTGNTNTEEEKKWHEKEAFRNTGIGSMVEAFKSIRRGIRKNKERRKKKVEEARSAVGSGTETYKQAKLITRANKRQRKKDIREIRKQEKDRIKLVKYRRKQKNKNA